MIGSEKIEKSRRNALLAAYDYLKSDLESHGGEGLSSIAAYSAFERAFEEHPFAGEAKVIAASAWMAIMMNENVDNVHAMSVLGSSIVSFGENLQMMDMQAARQMKIMPLD